MNEDKSRAIYFFHRLRLSDIHLTLKGRNISFVNNVKYLSVIFDTMIKSSQHIEMIEAKAFRTFIRVCSLFLSERLRANIK
jgi:acyl-ACP thioesterase